MKVLNVIVFILVLVGALNRGAIGFFDFNAVTWLANIVHPMVTDPVTAEMMVNPLAEKCATIVYDVVGASAIVLLAMKLIGCKKCCKK